MDDFDANSVTAFVKQCAANVVNAQMLYDGAFDENAAGAVRMRIASYEIEAELAVAVTRSRGFEIRVSPLNLGYRIMRRDTSEAGMRLTVRVEQVVAPEQEKHGIETG
jgi:hypothetical protein